MFPFFCLPLPEYATWISLRCHKRKIEIQSTDSASAFSEFIKLLIWIFPWLEGNCLQSLNLSGTTWSIGSPNKWEVMQKSWVFQRLFFLVQFWEQKALDLLSTWPGCLHHLFLFFPLDTNRLTWNLEDGSQSVLHGTAVTGRSGVGAGWEVEMCQECSPAGFGVSSALLVKSWQICTFPSRDCTSPAWSFLELVLMSCWELRKWVGAGGLPVLLNWACRMEG